jgi:3-oxoacyl-[acyl-carrier protein] reductase
MAFEWARFGVTVNAIAPGFIATRMTSPESGVQDAWREALVERIPLGRVGTPEDIAAAVSYLVSPRAGYVTGQVLEIHGGLADVAGATA